MARNAQMALRRGVRTEEREEEGRGRKAEGEMAGDAPMALWRCGGRRGEERGNSQ